MPLSCTDDVLETPSLRSCDGAAGAGDGGRSGAGAGVVVARPGPPAAAAARLARLALCHADLGQVPSLAPAPLALHL